MSCLKESANDKALRRVMEKAVIEALKDCKSVYDILHEIGHLVCGYSCCREHAEFEAHGAAKVIARVLGIPIDLKVAEEAMGCYAGFSAHEGCGRIAQVKKDARKRFIRNIRQKDK